MTLCPCIDSSHSLKLRLANATSSTCIIYVSNLPTFERRYAGAGMT
jgi:hypothetical protein